MNRLQEWFNSHKKTSTVLFIGMVISSLYIVRDNLQVIIYLLSPILIFIGIFHIIRRVFNTWNKLDKKLDEENNKTSEK